MIYTNLEEKEERKEFEKSLPFEVMLSPLGDERWKIKIVDRRTEEKRELVIKATDEKERLFEALTELEKRRSILESGYLSLCRMGISGVFHPPLFLTR